MWTSPMPFRYPIEAINEFGAEAALGDGRHKP
jgi:hypothetical protein